MKHFEPSWLPGEGAGVLYLLQLVDRAVPDYFAPDQPIAVARAPARLDVIGDAAGGLLLQLPLAQAACVAVQEREDEQLHVYWPGGGSMRSAHRMLQRSDFMRVGEPLGDVDSRALLALRPDERWAAPAFAALLVLMHQARLPGGRGLALLLSSDIAAGSSLGEDAAVATATLAAVAELGGGGPGCADLAALAARALAIVGTGGDALAATGGEADRLLALRGQPPAVDGQVVLPSDLEVLGLTLPAPAAAAVPPPVAGAAAERFRARLAQPPDELLQDELGDLMFAAHAAGGSEIADWLVDQVRQRRGGSAPLFGACSSGGSVAFVGRRGKAWYELLRLKKAALDRFGTAPEVLRWSSPGAAAFGCIRLLPKPA